MKLATHFIEKASQDFSIPEDTLQSCRQLIGTDKATPTEKVQNTAKVYELLVPYIADPAWAWDYGYHINPADFGPAGFVAINTQTFGESLAVLSKYSPLLFPFTISQQTNEDTHTLVFEFPECIKGNIAFLTNIITANMSANIQKYHGISHTDVSLDIPLLAETEALCESITQFNIRYEQPQLKIHFAKTLLDVKTAVIAEEQLSKQLLSLCDAQLQSLEQAKTFTETVQYILQRDENADLSLEALAELLNTTSRNVRRKLQAENTNFQTLKTQYRMHQATLLLANSELKIDTIAERCGYSTLANFHRAFSNALNMSPAEYRNREHTNKNDG